MKVSTLNKILGQHFLINQSAIPKIVAALDLKPNDTIVEIGPGKGALTKEIIARLQDSRIAKLILIEKDQKLAYSVQRIADSENLKIIIGDALKELPKIAKRLTLTANRFKVVGNIPYYITGKLLRILSEMENKPELAVLMIQKEVAERIIAKPPRMNLLAAAVQFWAEPKILFMLKPEDFNPPPKVESAVIRLTTKQQITTDDNKRQAAENYYKFIRILFKQPRKTIFNNLKTGLKLPKNEIETALKSLNIDPQIRPQNLSLKKIHLINSLFTPLWGPTP